MRILTFLEEFKKFNHERHEKTRKRKAEQGIVSYQCKVKIKDAEGKIYFFVPFVSFVVNKCKLLLC
jgi:hypothetical protein